MAEKPKVDASGLKELEKVQAQFDGFDVEIKSLAERVAMPPVKEEDEQTKLSTREINKSDAPYIKPFRSVSSKESFNEKYRGSYERDREYVRCVAENKELIGEHAEFWTKPYPGMAAEFWKVPVNKPVMLQRHVARRLAECSHIVYEMDENAVTGYQSNNSGPGEGEFRGRMVGRHMKRRLDCRPAGHSFISMAG